MSAVLDWLRKKKGPAGELPHYSRLKAIPSRGLPPELEERECSEAFNARGDVLQRELLEPARRPSDDKPLFTELLVAEQGVVTIPLPESDGQCLPVFTTPFRAADYVRTLLASGPRVQYLASSPLRFIRMIHDLESAGITHVAIDRCPRCSTFSTVGLSSTASAATVVQLWAIHKATELTRGELYFEYALQSARGGRLEVARDVALEAVGHVSFEDPRLHLLLGQVAIRMADRPLLREARAFLRFLSLAPWERKLDEAQRSGLVDFFAPE
jgi:hypothetical protein